MLTNLIEAAASNDCARLDATLAQEKARHPDLGDQPLAALLRQYKDANGRTALHFACHAGQHKMVAHILALAEGLPQDEAAVGWMDEKGHTPLTLAAAGGADRGKLVALLLAHGADPNLGSKEDGDGDGARALHHAAAHNDAAAVQALLQAGADINAPTDTGTALHWAAAEGAKDALQALVDAGADVNAVNGQGVTPIILAAAHGCGSSVAALAKAQADVGFILSGGGLTALHMIAEYGSLEAVLAILATGAPGAKCARHESDNGKPVHLAAWGGHREVVEALLPHSDVTESVDELMAWGKAKAVAYEEEQQKLQERQLLPPGQDSHHGGVALPPPAASAAAEQEALKHKEAANRHFVAQEYRAALDLYGQAIALNGRDPAFWSNRAGCLMKLERYEEALADAEMARALKPDWPKACYRMAEARLALKKYEDAALAAYEGIQLDAGNQPLHKLLKQAIDLGREEHQQQQQKGKEG